MKEDLGPKGISYKFYKTLVSAAHKTGFGSSVRGIEDELKTFEKFHTRREDSLIAKANYYVYKDNFWMFRATRRHPDAAGETRILEVFTSALKAICWQDRVTFEMKKYSEVTKFYLIRKPNDSKMFTEFERANTFSAVLKNCYLKPSKN